MTDVDTTAADTLDEVITALARRSVELHFAELKGTVKDRLRTYGIFDRLGPDRFHPTIGSAVRAYLARHPDVAWLDWEDEPRPPEDAEPRPSERETPPPPGHDEPQPPTEGPGGGIRRSGAPRQSREPGVDGPAGEE
jgi:hypothetical protein